MKRIVHGAGGQADVMKRIDDERPVPGRGEVLIEVHVAGVNRPDVLQRSGNYPPPKGEVGGEVAAAESVSMPGRQAIASARWRRAAAMRSTDSPTRGTACLCRRA